MGIAANNRQLFHAGIEGLNTELAIITADGTLGPVGLGDHYAAREHLVDLTALMLLCEFAESNGITLKASKRDALLRAVKLADLAISDPVQFRHFFEQRTGIKQRLPSVLAGDLVAWKAIATKSRPEQPALHVGGLPLD